MARPNDPQNAPDKRRLTPMRVSPGAYQLIVAMRYLRRNWLSYLAIIGVALSVMVLIVVLSVMTGFDEELRSRIRGTLSHLIVESAHTESFDGYDPLMEKIEALPGVVAVAPHLDGLALIKLGKHGDRYNWGQFSGIDLEREAAATEFTKYWRAGMRDAAVEHIPYQLAMLERIAPRDADGSVDDVYERYVELTLELSSRVVPGDYATLSEDERGQIEAWARERDVDLAALRAAYFDGVPEEEAARESERRIERLRLALPRVQDFRRRAEEEVAGARDEVLRLAAMLGAEGLGKLPEEAAAQVLALAEEAGVDLLERWNSATPSWGGDGLLETEGEVPVIAGRDVVVLGRDEAGHEVSLGIGQSIVLIAPVDWQDRAVRSCRIAGKIRSGMYEYDSRQVYLPLEAAQRLLRRSGQVSSLNVKLEDYGQADLIRCKILGLLTPAELGRWLSLAAPGLERMGERELARAGGEAVTYGEAGRKVRADLDHLNANYSEWMATGHPMATRMSSGIATSLQRLTRDILAHDPGAPNADALRAKSETFLERGEGGIGTDYRVWTWEDKRRNTLRAVWLERRIMAIILFLLVLVAGFVILANLHTSVITKTRDIGILKAMGATVRGIMALFVLNGLLIGVTGAALGTIGGLWLSAELNTVEDLIFRWFGFQVFPRDVYSLDQIPTASDPFWMVVIIAASAVLISFFSALYPAWRAARLDPVEAVRYE